MTGYLKTGNIQGIIFFNICWVTAEYRAEHSNPPNLMCAVFSGVIGNFQISDHS